MVFQNPWWSDKSKIYEDETVRKVANSPYRIPPIRENILLLGPRQVGKTTFLKTTIMEVLESEANPKKALFFSCDSMRDMEDLIELIHEYRNLINPNNGYIFLDEITYLACFFWCPHTCVNNTWLHCHLSHTSHLFPQP